MGHEARRPAGYSRPAANVPVRPRRARTRRPRNCWRVRRPRWSWSYRPLAGGTCGCWRSRATSTWRSSQWPAPEELDWQSLSGVRLVSVQDCRPRCGSWRHLWLQRRPPRPRRRPRPAPSAEKLPQAEPRLPQHAARRSRPLRRAARAGSPSADSGRRRCRRGHLRCRPADNPGQGRNAPGAAQATAIARRFKSRKPHPSPAAAMVETWPRRSMRF